MTDQLARVIAAYMDVEIGVQQLMALRCRAVCAKCESVCCRPDFCREALESPFLQRVVQRLNPRPLWHADRGWLGDRGCLLAAGRPPVCYAFYCRTIAEAQSAPSDRYALDVLARMMTFAGRRARGSRHLVELSSLAAVNVERLARQLHTAREALQQLRLYWENGMAPAMDLWRIICPGR